MEYHGFFPFCWFFFVLLAGLLIFKIFTFRRYGGWWHDRHDRQYDAESILMRRLANGEISEEEYHRLRDVLKK